MIASRKPAALCFSLLIVAFGCYVVYAGLSLPIGSMGRIGPGFFPIGLGVIIAVLGVASLFDRADTMPCGTFNFFSLFLVGLAILAFALLLETAGLFPAIAALVLLTCLAGRERVSLTVVLGTIGGLCAAGYFIFISALQLPLDPFVLGSIYGG